MACQVAARIKTFQSIKATVGDPVWGTGSQNPEKALETSPFPTVRSHRRGQAIQL